MEERTGACIEDAILSSAFGEALTSKIAEFSLNSTSMFSRVVKY